MIVASCLKGCEKKFALRAFYLRLLLPSPVIKGDIRNEHLRIL